MKKVLITGANGQLGNEIRFTAEKNQYNDLQFLYTDVEELDITDINLCEAFFKTNPICFI